MKDLDIFEVDDEVIEECREMYYYIEMECFEKCKCIDCSCFNQCIEKLEDKYIDNECYRLKQEGLI